MRDVNNGWIQRYIHANGASFFFIFVYIHIGRGLYYGSYRSPRGQLWIIGAIIYIVMMATIKSGSNWYGEFQQEFMNFILPFSSASTLAIKRIGPHSKEILDQIIWGMIGDWWADRIPSKKSFSYRFQIEQDKKHKEYIYFQTNFFYLHGYCASPKPILRKRKEGRYMYRLTLFCYSNQDWIYKDFNTIKNQNGYKKKIKKLPNWIDKFLTPVSLAALIMQYGSRQKGQGISIATNCFTYKECNLISKQISNKFKQKTSVVLAGSKEKNQWKVTIWKESMPKIKKIQEKHMIGNMIRKIN